MNSAVEEIIQKTYEKIASTISANNIPKKEAAEFAGVHYKNFLKLFKARRLTYKQLLSLEFGLKTKLLYSAYEVPQQVSNAKILEAIKAVQKDVNLLHNEHPTPKPRK